MFVTVRLLWWNPLHHTQSFGRARTAQLDEVTRADIDHAHAHIKAFAEAQLASLGEFEVELSSGLIAGQRNVPVGVVGCYVPAGRRVAVWVPSVCGTGATQVATVR